MRNVILGFICLMLVSCGNNAVINPPSPKMGSEVTNHGIVKGRYIDGLDAEEAVISFKGRKYLINCHAAYAHIYDFYTNQYIRSIGGMGNFGSAFTYNDAVYFVNTGGNHIYIFRSTDLASATMIANLTPSASESYYNSSVTIGPDGYFYMAYELSINNGAAYSFKFQRSQDLVTWEPVGQQFANYYSACPWIRYVNGYYYVIYLFSNEQRGVFESRIARSADLINWQMANDVFLTPSIWEGTNNSDVDILESNGYVYISYFTGDQMTWGKVGMAYFQGTMKDLFESFF